jgi:hypothetical protein
MRCAHAEPHSPARVFCYIHMLTCLVRRHCRHSTDIRRAVFHTAPNTAAVFAAAPVASQPTIIATCTTLSSASAVTVMNGVAVVAVAVVSVCCAAVAARRRSRLLSRSTSALYLRGYWQSLCPPILRMLAALKGSNILMCCCFRVCVTE